VPGLRMRSGRVLRCAQGSVVELNFSRAECCSMFCVIYMIYNVFGPQQVLVKYCGVVLRADDQGQGGAGRRQRQRKVSLSGNGPTAPTRTA
jgi:hypothetical protein